MHIDFAPLTLVSSMQPPSRAVGILVAPAQALALVAQISPKFLLLARQANPRLVRRLQGATCRQNFYVGDRSFWARQGLVWRYDTVFSIAGRSVKGSNRGLVFRRTKLQRSR